MIATEHARELGRVLLEESREIAFVHLRTMTGIRFWSSAARQ
jgi:hypothetical protein